MKEIVPQPPAIVRNDTAEIQSLFQQNVVPSYGRFDIVLSHGSGSQLWDVAGKRYLDLGGGKGHAGLVIEVRGDHIITIEGNTNPGGSSDGFGVFRRDSRPITTGVLLGYLDFCEI